MAIGNNLELEFVTGSDNISDTTLSGLCLCFQEYGTVINKSQIKVMILEREHEALSIIFDNTTIE